jgi:hypothetical protein
VIPPEFEAVRDAVFACGKEGHSSQEVIALLVKICVEISQETNSLTEGELREFVSALWSLNQGEQMIRITEALGVSDA